MKIVYTMPADLLCGGAIHHHQVIQRLAARGHQVLIYAPVIGDQKLLPSLPQEVRFFTHRSVRSNLYSLPSEWHPFQFLRAFLDLTIGLRAIARDLPPDADIVHATFYPNVFAADLMRQRKKSRCKIFLSVHDDPEVFLPISYRRYWKIWAKGPFRADYLLTVSKALKEILRERYQKPTAIVGNGVDESLLQNPPTEAEQAAKLIKAKNRPYLLYVGSINFHKGVDILFEAFSLFQRRNPHFLLVLVGKCSYPPFLQGLMKKYSLGDQVRHLEAMEQKHLVPLYDHASCFVFPSRTEGFGLPPLEAMARGCPVICTPCKGIYEYARPDENSVFVPPENPQKLAEAIQWLLDHREEAARIGQAGKRVAQSFTWDRVADRTEKAMLEALSGDSEK